MSLVTLSKRKQLHKDTVTKLWQETNLVNALKSNPSLLFDKIENSGVIAICLGYVAFQHKLYLNSKASEGSSQNITGQRNAFWTQYSLNLSNSSDENLRFSLECLVGFHQDLSIQIPLPPLTSPFSNKPLHWKNLHI